ncbi:MAG TPA: hypothetical protein DCQ98_08190 [Planctomycetaceae bacterium]|nr:hypothetical protein [Planctomycetaceae bacterium]
MPTAIPAVERDTDAIPTVRTFVSMAERRSTSGRSPVQPSPPSPRSALAIPFRADYNGAGVSIEPRGREA